MSKPALHYTLHISHEDDTGRITITSPDEPGLLIWEQPVEAFSDVHWAFKKLRLLNARARMETEVLRCVTANCNQPCAPGSPFLCAEHGAKLETGADDEILFESPPRECTCMSCYACFLRAGQNR